MVNFGEETLLPLELGHVVTHYVEGIYLRHTFILLVFLVPVMHSGEAGVDPQPVGIVRLPAVLHLHDEALPVLVCAVEVVTDESVLFADADFLPFLRLFLSISYTLFVVFAVFSARGENCGKDSKKKCSVAAAGQHFRRAVRCAGAACGKTTHTAIFQEKSYIQVLQALLSPLTIGSSGIPLLF